MARKLIYDIKGMEVGETRVFELADGHNLFNAKAAITQTAKRWGWKVAVETHQEDVPIDTAAMIDAWRASGELPPFEEGAAIIAVARAA